MSIVTFTLTDPSSALIAEIMQAIERHNVSVPEGLRDISKPTKRKQQSQPQQLSRASARPQQLQPGPSGYQAKKPAKQKAEVVKPKQKQLAPPINKKAAKAKLYGLEQHCPKYAEAKGLQKQIGMTYYKISEPYALPDFKVMEASEDLVAVSEKDPMGSFEKRLYSMGFPKRPIKNVVPVFEFSDHYIVVFFPGSNAEIVKNVPKDSVSDYAEAQLAALLAARQQINQIHELGDILPTNYLNVLDSGTQDVVVSDEEDDSDSAQ
uniref:p29 n=1 Tax=Citrus leprosis virus C TaxID=347219 RepID=A0A0N9EK39_9VIRU|nr:p29 [Citrus leprosis virus C]